MCITIEIATRQTGQPVGSSETVWRKFHKNQRVHMELMQIPRVVPRPTRQNSQHSTGAAAAGPVGSGAAVDCAGPGA